MSYFCSLHQSLYKNYDRKAKLFFSLQSFFLYNYPQVKIGLKWYNKDSLQVANQE